MTHFESVPFGSFGAPENSGTPAQTALTGFRYRGEAAWDDRFDGTMWRYRCWLPVKDATSIVTLGEGGTPLLTSKLHPHTYWKDESRNPTGSHKDRALAVALSHAQEIGASASIVVSAGSTGLSNAAYASRAGISGVTIMSRGAHPERTYPLHALGAITIELDTPIDDLIAACESVCTEQGLYLSSTTRRSNPYQAEGCKTIAFEIVEDLGRAPDWLVLPVGGGGTISAVWRGFEELRSAGMIDVLPRLVGVVPKDYNALEVAFRDRISTWADLEALPYKASASSILTKLTHCHPPDGLEALDAVRASEGFFVSVTDDEALDGQQQLGRGEGIYVEPSSGAVAPIVEKLRRDGAADVGEIIVALLCGSGFRETFVSLERRPMNAIQTTLADFPRVLANACRPT